MLGDAERPRVLLRPGACIAGRCREDRDASLVRKARMI
jgi:hypothetical protein